ncbi:MAG: hypothetical protein C0412_18485 [Flavobacterium sp.]|nr:hypothetical protein [Flavobacterium sp.]
MKDLSERRIPLLLFFLVLFSYVNSLSGEFVWDDHVQIAENQFIRKINNIPMLFTIGNDATFHQEIFTVNYYRPLQVLTYIFDYHIWGLKPFGFHLTNILLHYFNSFFVFILIYLITNKKLPAFLVSILFAVHPVNTSSVSYISGRADLIAMFFILLTFIFWIKGITINTSYLLSIFFFSLSLLAKEIAVVLPFLLLFYAYIEFSKNKDLLRKIFVKITPFFALIFIYFLIRKFILENIKLQSVNLHFFPLLSTLCKIFCLYLKMLVFPNNLYIGHDTLISTATIFPFIFLFIAFAFLPIMLIFINHNFVRKILFFTAWFIAFLLPQLFPMHADYSRRVLMAEHWIYVSSVALYFIIANIVVFL